MAEGASLNLVYRGLSLPLVYLLLVNHVLGGIRLPERPVHTDSRPGMTAEFKVQSDDLCQLVSGRWTDISQPYGDSTKEDRARAVKNGFRHMEPFDEPTNILNGIQWVYLKQYWGNPFLSQDYWPDAVLVYRGIEYTGLKINYDLYTDQLIILYVDDDSKKYFVLSNAYLESLSFTDTVNNAEHIYEYFKIPGTDDRDLYEKVYDGETALMIRPRCEIQLERSGMYMGEYIRSYEYYVRAGDRYIPFHSKKTLLNALQRNNPELKKFIRINRLKINKLRPDHIVLVLKYFDTLL